MATVEITNDNFQATIDQGGIVLLDWWAPWCGPCRAFGPVYERVAAKHPNITFGKVNTEQEPGLAMQFQINSIPTLMVIRDKTLLFSQAGMLPERALEDLVRQAEAIDMGEVQKKLGPQPKAAAAVH
ncbi:MAG: thioredoxin family protein [Polyangiaceae bacterium]|nr:thioredoxin family protein [Polyangiaceae bacterium]